MTTFPPEWAPLQFVQMAWPHAGSDWRPYLDSARRCFAAIGLAIASRGTRLLIVTADVASTRAAVALWPAEAQALTYIVECPTDDTWVRDTGFLTLVADGEVRLTDFCFNGWGEKFEASRDNAINARITADVARLYAPATCRYVGALDVVLEGGSVESDGRGTVLTTASCLLAPHRNGFATRREAEQALLPRLGAQRMLWLGHGWLVGDDTDGHIDTLARFAPDDTIVYVGIDDPADEHYEELRLMEQELRALRTADGRPYRLLALPMAPALYERDFADAAAGEEGQRLPATYANYLVIDRAVLMPTYADPSAPAQSEARRRDAEAMAVIGRAFPGREVVGIDCRVLVRQHGSLHCSTMQFPRPDGWPEA